MSDRPITVLLADDQDLIREALGALLSSEQGIHVVGMARNGLEAVEKVRNLNPDVVLMDVRMPGLSGPEATAQIKSARETADTRVLILTTFEEREVVKACIGAGADGVVGKGISTGALLEAIVAVLRGDSPLSPRAARSILSELTDAGAPRKPDDPDFSDLTPREEAIVKLVSLGLSNLEIGRRLSISPATVKTHVRNAMRKLKVHDRAQLVALIHRVGMAR